jgi:hypothetical protein
VKDALPNLTKIDNVGIGYFKFIVGLAILTIFEQKIGSEIGGQNI